MSIRMLIDASHREETRVAIVDGNKLEDFDYESSVKKQLKGSIYLAKVTRVEPSLQAAFVDYGGNRHGFLAFSEIHPDYYQIPVADREALIAEEAAANADLLEQEEDAEEKPKRGRRRPRRTRKADKEADTKEETSSDDTEAEAGSDAETDTDTEEKAAKPKRRARRSRKKDTEDDAVAAENPEEADSDLKETKEEKETDAEAEEEAKDEDAGAEEKKPARKRTTRRRKPRTKAEAAKEDDVIIEGVNEEDADKEASSDSDDENQDDGEQKDEKSAKGKNKSNRKEKENDHSEEEEEERLRIRMAKRLRFKYKIQEVIKKNQIILVQVVKEERGNKGAALTTYLSLPGRYCVLMPNTLHGGGVSRKIANVKDRKKLKNVLSSLNMPKGHACIIRTAGADRTKAEIKRDYDYLKRMWEAIRENTLKSIAPTQIYEEGNLIKRSIRDLYTRDISEILVEGERGYNTAKDFMQLLMPSHAKRVKQYEDPIPVFQRYQVENHLDAIYSPTAQLKSGGYIVINPTEALVSIDVNSGRATKEHNIEETALKTNLEAAAEVARQLKLRDMAGLVVIDFIDMEEPRNNRAVERKMKECIKNDRARIQVGRISNFGLMEMSRQRLRVGVLESSTNTCPHCEGSGLLRSVESQALHILRVIEEEAIRAKNSVVTIYLPSRVAVYILNNKRNNLTELESRYDFSVTVAIDEELTASAYRMDKSGKPSRVAQRRKDSLRMGKDVNKLIDVTEEDVSPAGDKKERPKRRRRRRRGQQDKNPENTSNAQDNQEANETDASKQEDGAQEKPKRGRRRGRRTDKNKSEANAEVAEVKETDPQKNEEAEKETEKPKRTRRTRTRKKADEEKPSEVKSDETSVKDEKAEAKPKRAPRKRKPKDSATKDEAMAKDVKKETPKTSKPKEKQEEEKPAKPKKTGWWSR